jgi:hypothetical protein
VESLFRNRAPFSFVSKPSAADSYKPRDWDVVDMELSACLHRLHADLLPALMIAWIRPGCYDINGRRVGLHWIAGAGSALQVHEEDLFDQTHRVPLQEYLQQAANVAKSLRCSSPIKDANLPMASRLTFANVGIPSQTNLSNDERLNCMYLACKQAKIREKILGERREA